MKINSKTIGVVAGAGPFAGVDLLKKIFEQTIATTDQEHMHVIGLFDSPNLPDRTAYLLDPTLPNPGEAIAQQLLDLQDMGAVIAGIPCNTAHAPAILNPMLARLENADAHIHFVNMIAETVVHIQKYHPGITKVGILSTTGTYRTGIYPLYLETSGLQTVLPDENIQTEIVHPAIYDPHYGIKAAGCGTLKAREDLLSAVSHLAAKGAQAVVLGCTEIPLAIPETMLQSTPFIDPTTILARAMVREAAPEKLKPFSAGVPN